MNPYLKAAIDFISAKAGPDYSISPNSIQETDDYYCFTYLPTKYLTDDNSLEVTSFGGGFNILSKADGRIFSYSSSISVANAMVDLSEQLKKELEVRKQLPSYNLTTRYSLTIVSNYSAEKLAVALLKYKTNFIIPEVVGDSIFRINTPYTKEQLMNRLSMLPTTFNRVDLDCDLMLELLAIRGCHFKIMVKEEESAAKHIRDATSKDLEPIW